MLRSLGQNPCNNDESVQSRSGGTADCLLLINSLPMRRPMNHSIGNRGDSIRLIGLCLYGSTRAYSSSFLGPTNTFLPGYSSFISEPATNIQVDSQYLLKAWHRFIVVRRKTIYARLSLWYRPKEKTWRHWDALRGTLINVRTCFHGLIKTNEGINYLLWNRTPAKTISYLSSSIFNTEIYN